jgi:hypothetical protein
MNWSRVVVDLILRKAAVLALRLPHQGICDTGVARKSQPHSVGLHPIAKNRHIA